MVGPGAKSVSASSVSLPRSLLPLPLVEAKEATEAAGPRLSLQIAHQALVYELSAHVCYLFFLTMPPDSSSPGPGSMMGREACLWLTEDCVYYSCPLFYFYCTNHEVPCNYKARLFIL